MADNDGGSNTGIVAVLVIFVIVVLIGGIRVESRLVRRQKHSD
jgi:hypothetical protein